MTGAMRIGLAMLPLLGIGAGFSGTLGPAALRPAVAASQSRVPEANPADVHFMTTMIHHHAQALMMADLAAKHSSSRAIGMLSERIRVSQTDEIALLQQWLRDRGVPAPEAAGSIEVMFAHGSHDHSMHMTGMLTREQFARLEEARGAEFDRLFLIYMIEHHEGALDMVETLFASHGGGVEDFVYKIASDTFADQGSEIDRMQRMLDALSAGR
jgi:uncharacterized protein (DUF305 family)